MNEKFLPPVRNQLTEGTCAAQSFADLTDYFRFSHGKSDYISAPILAIQNKQRLNNEVNNFSIGNQLAYAVRQVDKTKKLINDHIASIKTLNEQIIS